MRVALVRHGEVDTVVGHALSPKFDGPGYDLLPLSQLGVQHVRHAVQKLSEFPAVLILSSPYNYRLFFEKL